MFTVAWSKDAQGRLINIWIKANSVDRRELTSTVALLDKHLRANADRIGESREDESLRFVATGLLGIEFQVSEQDRLVIVLRAWIVPSRKN